jgi:hypothetical protein
MWARASPMDDYADNIDIDIVEYEELVIVAVDGEVDLYSASVFEESLVVAGTTDAPAIIVDLDRVSFMDLAGSTSSFSWRSRMASVTGCPSPVARRRSGACSTSRWSGATSRSCAHRRERPTAPRPRRACVSPGPETGQSASSAPFSVALGRIAAATFSMSGR